MIYIRKFEQNDEDYHKALAVHNAVWTEYPDTVAEWKDNDSRRSSKIKWARYLAEVDGEPVGMASYGQSLSTYHPQKFRIGVDVLPGYRRRGIGRQLFEHLMQELAQYDPLKLSAHTREDCAGAVEFATTLGFTECMRDWESRLAPQTVNLEEWRKYPERLAAAGIEIKTARELESDPERNAKLYALDMQLERDVPSPEPFSGVPFEEWVKVWERPGVLPDAWFVAVRNGEYLGESNLWKSEALERVLYTGLTGVRRDYRRQGIATALKLAAIRYAQEHNFAEVRTWNEVNNQGMLGINLRLGFVRQPAFISYEKTLRQEDGAVEANSAAIAT